MLVQQNSLGIRKATQNEGRAQQADPRRSAGLSARCKPLRKLHDPVPWLRQPLLQNGRFSLRNMPERLLPRVCSRFLRGDGAHPALAPGAAEAAQKFVIGPIQKFSADRHEIRDHR